MRKIGLKLWSINADSYLSHAGRLHDEGVFDYIELYVVPGTLDSLRLWRRLKTPFIIHNAHFRHGFNLAKAECRRRNMEIYGETARFADALNASLVIFHGGIDGRAEETARQLKEIRDPRGVLENKPYIALPNKMGGKFCRGAAKEELEYILSEAGCGFCLDIGHAVCAACSQGLEPYSYVEELNGFKPAMYHLSDVEKLDSPYDTHWHIGSGELDLDRIIGSVLAEDALISLETDKDSRDNLDDFREDALRFRAAEKKGRGKD